MEELLALSEAFCSFLAALNCLVANSSAFALFGTTPRCVLSEPPRKFKLYQCLSISEKGFEKNITISSDSLPIL